MSVEWMGIKAIVFLKMRLKRFIKHTRSLTRDLIVPMEGYRSSVKETRRFALLIGAVFLIAAYI